MASNPQLLVLAACAQVGVRKLLFTSTPSVTFDGTDAMGITEAEAPYPERFLTPYASTKAEASSRPSTNGTRRISKPRRSWASQGYRLLRNSSPPTTRRKSPSLANQQLPHPPRPSPATRRKPPRP